jgi:hypothetical protein
MLEFDQKLAFINEADTLLYGDSSQKDEEVEASKKDKLKNLVKFQAEESKKEETNILPIIMHERELMENI